MPAGAVDEHRVATPVDLSGDEIDRFRQHGFVAIDRLIDDAEVATLRAAYDDILDHRLPAPGDRHLGGLIRQVMAPSTVASVFATTTAIREGCAVAQRVFGDDDVERTYEMLIDKPPGTEHETPWHQDIGYFGRPVAPAGLPGGVRSLQFWVALDDVDTTNGCMEFSPRPFGSVALAHVVAAGDPGDESRLIALADDRAIDADLVTSCPLVAGGCTVHFVTTPHRTGPNVTTDRHRRAFIFNVGPRAMADAARTVSSEVWAVD